MKPWMRPSLGSESDSLARAPIPGFLFLMRQHREPLAGLIQSLSPEEVHAYSRFRWTTVGGHAAPFDGAAVGLIAQASLGVPRPVNSICDNALLNAFAEGKSTVEAGDVKSALSDLDLLAGVCLPANTRVQNTSPVQRAAAVRSNDVGDSVRAPQTLLDRWAGRFGFVHHNGKI